MSPRFSVCVPTNRVGGIDIQLAGLAQQTYRDFEVIISDSLYRHRPGIAEEHGKRLGLTVKHVEPRSNRFPLNQFSAVANEALAHASGELVLFCVDYTFLPPNVLQTHADFHASGDKTRGLMLPHEYYELPALNSAFPKYTNADTSQYVDDLEAGRLSECMLSILAERVEPGHVFTQLDQTGYAGADPKLTHPETDDIDPVFLHGKNESCALSAVLDINGWDEDLDGGHGYQDSDIAERLTQKGGIRWTLRNAPAAQIINPRRIFPFPVRPRSVEGNYAVWQSKKAAGYPTPNTWKIRP